MRRQYRSAFPRPFRDRFKSETRICSFEYMLAFWGEKKPADGASTCPPSCSNTRRSDFKTSTSAHAQLGPIQQRVAAHQVILNLMTLYPFFLFMWRAHSQQSAQIWNICTCCTLVFMCNTFKLLQWFYVLIPFLTLFAHLLEDSIFSVLLFF